ALAADALDHLRDADSVDQLHHEVEAVPPAVGIEEDDDVRVPEADERLPLAPQQVAGLERRGGRLQRLERDLAVVALVVGDEDAAEAALAELAADPIAPRDQRPFVDAQRQLAIDLLERRDQAPQLRALGIGRQAALELHERRRLAELAARDQLLEQALDR